MSFFLTASLGEHSNHRLVVGAVSQEIGTEGGCSLQLPSQFAKREGAYIFVSDLDKHAVVNVDGEDVQLELVESKGSRPGRATTIGERSTDSYSGSGSGLDVEVSYTLPRGYPVAERQVCKIT
jgi:hypothetical protein